MKKRVKITICSDKIQLREITEISFVNKQYGSDFDLDKSRMSAENLMYDIIGAFSPRIIRSLERRMEACLSLLINHIDDVEYCDELGHICWRTKDSFGGFNVHSYHGMEECIENLKVSNFKKVCQNKLWIDQILKALLNDDIQDHSKEGSFKYSQLVSILCELQACPPEYLPE